MACPTGLVGECPVEASKWRVVWAPPHIANPRPTHSELSRGEKLTESIESIAIRKEDEIDAATAPVSKYLDYLSPPKVIAQSRPGTAL